MTPMDDPADRALRLLSPREKDCLRLVFENHSSKEIARRLGISQTSVDTHVRNARAKLGVSDRYEAARRLYAFEQAPPAPVDDAPAQAGPAHPPARLRGRFQPPPLEE